MGLFSKVFGTYSSREVKKVEVIADKVIALEEKYSLMGDDELRSQTSVLKERLAQGETLDDILPEAFATVREAAWRVLGMKHYRVQIIGGIVLHQGRIAEMKTGEGKTLVATLPAYLNALSGKGVHIVTVNDYLAKRSGGTGFMCNYFFLIFLNTKKPPAVTTAAAVNPTITHTIIGLSGSVPGDCPTVSEPNVSSGSVVVCVVG